MIMMTMSHTTPHASPAGPSASTPYRPSPSSGTPCSSSSSKPRLLYRGPLRLSDGTLLNGVAFVSTVDPFEKVAGEGGGGGGAAGADDADICLALEMARGQRCLSIEAMSSSDSLTTSTSGAPLKQIAGGQGVGGAAGWEHHLEASGKIRMYIDPNEPLSAAFFERNFCCGEEGWEEGGKERSSRTAFLISTGPSIPAATTIAVPQTGASSSSAQSQHDDVFTNAPSSAVAAPLPLVERRSAALQLVLFARMSETSMDGVLEIVVGRRVAQRRRVAAAGAKAEGAAVAGGSTATVTRRASQGVRPDDPLPRVAGGIVGQKVKQPELPTQPAPAGSGPSTWRKTASAPNLARPSPAPPAARGVAKASAEGGADMSLMSVKEEDDDEQPSAPSSSRATSAGARGASSTAPAITGGNHTPGRRGEKRRSTTTATAKQQQQRSQEHLLLSPTSSKRRRTALAPTAAALTKGASSSSSSTGVAAPPRPDPLPLQPLQPPQPRSRRDAASPTPGLDAPPLSATFAPPSTTAKASSSSSTGYNAIETKNRAMIKKLVQHQLLGRGLERRRPRGTSGPGAEDDSVLPEEDDAARDEADAGDEAGGEDGQEEEEDFDRLFLGAYTSTCVALRKDLHKKTVRRDVAARVVRWHLDLYLEDRDCAMTGGGGGGAGAAEA